MSNINDPSKMEQKIAERTDLALAGSTEVSTAVGGLAFKDMSQVLEFSKLMAVSRQAVPKHLRDQPGMCMAVTLQALNWRMDPFQVANKSYSVNDRVAYEAQLIQAVIEQRAPIKGRIKGKYIGEGDARQCVLRVISAEDGEEIEYTSPKIADIKVKNSPLWKTDPDQQLWYYSARAMCRRHFPDVLLGVYEKEEIQNAPEIKDVTPDEPRRSAFTQKARAAREPEEAETIPEEQQDEAEEKEVGVHWTDEVDTSEAFPGDTVFTEGRDAAKGGAERTDCPHDEDLIDAANWLAGWDSYGTEEEEA